jgi:histidine ammonia-lyase
MIFLNGNDLSIFDLEEIVINNSQIGLTSKTIEQLNSGYKFLSKFASGRLIYGINTGFGPMAQFKIDDHKQNELQYNLIRSHASGFGPWLSKVESKAILVARINSLVRGQSGVHPSLITLMVEMSNRNIIPIIPSHGGVGASGDLVQLAHIALAVIGEGEVYYNDKVSSTKDAIKAESLKPFKILLREGIAILNGTSGMTGLAALNLCDMQNALEWMIIFSAMINELMEAFDDHFSAELNNTKKHKGQQEIAEIVRNIIAGSKLIRSRNNHWDKVHSHKFFRDKVQEFYSIRCVPQILGPILDTLYYCKNIVENEINSTSDNPIAIVEADNVFHGGNFHGDYVSLEMDKLKLVATKLAMISERQLNFLVNPDLNKKLPSFLNMQTPGLNFGVQGMQFTATSTTSENQTLSTSSYIHSIPSNNDNQDIVSMGFNAAKIAQKIINNTFEVITIEAIAILQAVTILKIEDKLSSFNQDIYFKLRNIFPSIILDRATYKEQEILKNYLKSNRKNLLKR